MRLLASIALLAVLGTAHAADLKVGVVDMNKAFSEYYKTKDAAAKIKENKDKVTSELNERYTTYKNLVNDVQKKKKEAEDPVLTAEGKAKAMNEFDNKVKEVRALEQDMNEFQQRRSMQLKQEEMQLQKGLYDEITQVVKDKSKSGSYDFVFDKSGVGMSSVPILLYYKDATDFTDEVIVELNKNAPSDAAKAEAKKDADKSAAKPEDKKK